MMNWCRTVWRNRNKLFGLVAVMVIVLAAVWFYGGDLAEPNSKSKAATQQALSATEPTSAEQLRLSDDADSGASTNALGAADAAGAADADTKDSGTAGGDAEPRQETVPGQDEPSPPLSVGTTEGKALSGADSEDKKTNAAAAEAQASSGNGAGAGSSASGYNAATKSGQDKNLDGDKSSGKDKSNEGIVKDNSIAMDKGGAQKTEATSRDFVTLTIVGPPDIGTIMETIQVDISGSKTVLDVLKKATRSQKMQMEYTGSGATAYVQGIDNLYEFDKGSGSGWMYSVNGKFPNRSAGIWPLSSGDDIQWLYTEDLGKDLGAGTDDGLWDGKS